MPVFKRNIKESTQKSTFLSRYTDTNRFTKILRVLLLVALLLTITFGTAKILTPECTEQRKLSEIPLNTRRTPSLNDIIHESQKYLGTLPDKESTLPLGIKEFKTSAAVSKNTSHPPVISPAAGETFLVVIDPGHQQKADMNPEPIAPWSTLKKPRVSGGAAGVRTGIKESILMLQISKILKEELERKGMRAVLTREREEVNISNKERAMVANSLKADLFLRLHANSSSNPGVTGALALYQQPHPSLIEASKKSKTAAQIILDIYCQRTGMKNLGINEGKDMTGLNWSKVPAVILELGFLSNPEDEVFMVSESGKNAIVKAISEGIIAYKNSLD